MRSDSPASKTAFMVAGYRARASERDESVCNDPWADALAGADGRAFADAFDSGFAHMELWIAVRTEYLDRHVRYWTDTIGFAQVVILGAGFDTRAARLASDGVRFFEVDHPSTQSAKKSRLASLEGYPVDSATYVECDFESGANFITQLEAAGFDTGAPALVLWEGVTPYLSEEAIRATANKIASKLHPQSVLVFDYLSRRMAEGDRLRRQDEAAREEVDKMGEPIRYGFKDPLPLLYEEGFRHVRVVNFDQACLSITGSYDRAHEFAFQGMVIASPTTPTAP